MTNRHNLKYWCHVGFQSLANSGTVLVLLCGCVIMLCGYITCIQIPKYTAVREMHARAEYNSEINEELRKLKVLYYENSVQICSYYQESLFMNAGEYDESLAEKYTDSDISCMVMTAYYKEFVAPKLEAELDTLNEETTMFVTMFKENLLLDDNMVDLIAERESIYTIMEDLKSKRKTY